jgi:hypothetical protein
MESHDTVKTTLGELIAALTEETAEVVRDKREADKIVAFIVTHMLNTSAPASRKWQYWQ